MPASLYDQLSPKFQEQIDRIRRYAKKKEGEIAQNFSNFTLHDLAHFEQVATNAAKLLQPLSPSALSEENRFALLAACYLHDIGMANGAAKRSLFWIDQEEARKLHARLSFEDILNDNEVGGECIEDEGLRWAIARISEGHGRWDWDHGDFDSLHDVQIRFCTAILSLADALDLRNGRRNPAQYNSVDALLAADALDNDVSRVHWLRHYYSGAPSIQAHGARGVRINLSAMVGVMCGPDGRPMHEENGQRVPDVRADVIREIIQGDVVELLDYQLFRDVTEDFLRIELARNPNRRARVAITAAYTTFLFPPRLVKAAFEGGLIKPATVELRTAKEYYETRIEPFFAADDFQVSVAWRPGSLSPQEYASQSSAQSEHVRRVKEVARTHWDIVLWPFELYVQYLVEEVIGRGDAEQARQRIAHLLDVPDLIASGELKRVFLPEEGVPDPVTATRFIAKEGTYEGIFPTAGTFRGGAVHRRNEPQKLLFTKLCQRAARQMGIRWSGADDLGAKLAACCRTDLGYRKSLETVATILDRLRADLPAGSGDPELRSFLDASRAFVAAKLAVDEVRDGAIRARMARLTPERLDEVLRMEQASFRYAWTSRERFGEYIGERRAFALFSGNELVGYLLVAFRDDVLDLDKMAVSPLHRDQGFGRFTMRWVERYAAELGRRAVFLRVRESNREAISLYESEGFAVVERKEGYYHRTDNEAALEMEKPVSVA